MNRDNEGRQGYQEAGSSGHRSNTHHGRRGDIARKTVDRDPRLKVASKAARKTFAEPLSESESQDELSNHTVRSTAPSAIRSAFGKRGIPAGADPQERGSISNVSRRVTFSPETHSRTPASAAEGRSIPVRGLYGQTSITPPQIRTHFASKSANPNMARRDPFASGINQRSVGPVQPRPKPPFNPAHRFGPDQRRPGPPMQPPAFPSRFPHMPAGRAVSMPGHGSFSTPSKSTLYRSPPSKSRPIPSLSSLEDTSWRKGLSPRKTSAMYPGARPAPRMIAASISAPRKNAIRTSTKGDHINPDNVGPAVFLGRNMTIYMDGEEEIDRDSDDDIPDDLVMRPLIGDATGKTEVAKQVGRKAGKQIHSIRMDRNRDTSESSEEISDSSEEEKMDSDAGDPSTESDSQDLFSERLPSPSNDLVASLEVLTLSPLRMQQTRQLPFLLRNLRRGFKIRCHQVGVATASTARFDNSVEVELTFRLLKSGAGMEYSDEYNTHTAPWNCPLCDLHGRFNTQGMLQKHLEWDHSEIKTVWNHEHEKSGMRITLYVPEPQADQELPNAPIQDEIHDEPPQLRSPPGPAPLRSQSSSPVLSKVEPPVLPLQESVIHLRLKNQPPSPPRSVTPSTSLSSFSRSRSRSVTTAESRQQTREPSSQPPLDDLLGPTAQYPYLPEDPVDGEVYFSCRPGGPRIYDLLNTLPLAPFGILSWYIIDREEELFEADDVLDEDKAMQALWGRWILLNHQRFLADYFKGTKAFIDENWRMIHRAAGWAALRAWLLMFVVNRFLTGTEVASLLRHYEKWTNMSSWRDTEA